MQKSYFQPGLLSRDREVLKRQSSTKLPGGLLTDQIPIRVLDMDVGPLWNSELQLVPFWGILRQGHSVNSSTRIASGFCDGWVGERGWGKGKGGDGAERGTATGQSQT